MKLYNYEEYKDWLKMISLVNSLCPVYYTSMYNEEQGIPFPAKKLPFPRVSNKLFDQSHIPTTLGF
jgi:hypothetical protein